MKSSAENIRVGMTRWVISIICIICLVACQPKEKNDIQLQCRYMAYACGDCYPQYKITDVLNDSIAKRELSGKDINLEFENEEKEQEFVQLQGNCGICFLYKFKGDLRYSITKGHILKVSDYNLEKYPECCEN